METFLKQLCETAEIQLIITSDWLRSKEQRAATNKIDQTNSDQSAYVSNNDTHFVCLPDRTY